MPGLSRRLFACAAAFALAQTAAPSLAIAQDDARSCVGLLYSTSEDFQAFNPPPDGPVISDGDLLARAPSGAAAVCRRNADLIRQFDIEGVDLGLDAVHAVRKDAESEPSLIAFSTELDSPNGGQFTAGDLLFDTGAAIPNVALLQRFDVRRSLDLGLDALQIVGEPESIRGFAERARAAGRGAFVQNPGLLLELFEAFDVDVWFSTEGTAPERDKPLFLDGDLLSARTGAIVRPQTGLFAMLPAGVPDRGVDYGLDAYTMGLDPLENTVIELLSSEIVGRGRTTFTDGDVLSPGPNLHLRNIDLIGDFKPRSFDMGLDALHLHAGRVADCVAPGITGISDVAVADIDASPIAGDGKTVVDDRPFGGDIRIVGSLPDAANCPDFANYEYRVEIDDGGGFDTPMQKVAAHPETNFSSGAAWRRIVRPMPASPCPPGANDVYASDADGWFAVSEYSKWHVAPCGYGHGPALAVWDSAVSFPVDDDAAPGGPSVGDVLIRVKMRPVGGGGPTFISNVVKVRIDNERIDLPNNLLSPATGDMWYDIYLAGGASPIGDQCTIEGEGADVTLDLQGRAFDDHFLAYDLSWSGGYVVGRHAVASTPALSQRFDGGRLDLTATGTQPPGSNAIPLATAFNLSAAYTAVATAQSLPDTALPDVCGYTIFYGATERTILRAFAPNANVTVPVNTRREMTRSFCVAR